MTGKELIVCIALVVIICFIIAAFLGTMREASQAEDTIWNHPRETLPEKPEELSVKDLEPHGKAGPPPEGNCAYCGRPLRKGEGHWVIDEWGQLARKCNDSRSCYERMGEDNRKSFKRALRRFGPRGGM